MGLFGEERRTEIVYVDSQGIFFEKLFWVILGGIIFSLLAVSWIVDKTIGPWIHTIYLSYLLYFIVAPLLLCLTPQQLASLIGLKSETEIQKYYNSLNDMQVVQGIASYADIIFASTMLIILLYYVSKNLEKGKVKSLVLYYSGAFFTVSIPLSSFLDTKFSIVAKNYNFQGHYMVIYSNIQKYLVGMYELLGIVTVILFIISYFIIKILILVKKARLNAHKTMGNPKSM